MQAGRQAGRCEAAHHEALLKVVGCQAQPLQLPPDVVPAQVQNAHADSAATSRMWPGLGSSSFALLLHHNAESMSTGKAPQWTQLLQPAAYLR